MAFMPPEVICARSSTLVKPKTVFPIDGTRTDLTGTKWSISRQLLRPPNIGRMRTRCIAIKKHQNVLKTHTALAEAYHVIFVETPDADKLDNRENYWISKVNATINIAKTFLPKYK